MKKILEECFWSLLEAAQTIHAVTGVVLNEVENSAHEGKLFSTNRFDNYWTHGWEELDSDESSDSI